MALLAKLKTLKADYTTAKKHKLKQRGFKYPVTTVREARNAGVPLSIACSILKQESGGGQNVFGHDGVKNPIKGGKVTKDRYLAYKRYRIAGLGMQGVGPMQLTWYSFQDAADKLGGCWVPKYNMRVGFEHLAALIKSKGKYDGIRAYNGTGTAADNYAKQVIRRADEYHDMFMKD